MLSEGNFLLELAVVVLDEGRVSPWTGDLVLKLFLTIFYAYLVYSFYSF